MARFNPLGRGGHVSPPHHPLVYYPTSQHRELFNLGRPILIKHGLTRVDSRVLLAACTCHCCLHAAVAAPAIAADLAMAISVAVDGSCCCGAAATLLLPSLPEGGG